MAAVLIPSFILLMCFWISPSLQHISEAEPLVSFKNSVKITKGDLNSWKIGTDPCGGKWFGIYCHKGQTVTGIHVTQLGLSGTIIVDDLKALPNLKTVRLDNNLLSGHLPNFSILRGLKSLMLSNNSFSGEIPDGFFKDLPRLKRLFLDHNKFVGNIPSSIMQLPDLEEVHLQGNKFTGEIPPLSDVNKNMKILDLSGNLLEGEVPESIPNRKNLTANFEGNEDLCGKSINIECESVEVTPSGQITLPPTTRPESTHASGIVYAIMLALTFLCTFFIVVGAIKRRNKKKNAEFRMLDKERLSDLDALQVKVPEVSKNRGGNMDVGSTKKGGVGGGGGGGGGEVGGGMSDLVMVNNEKGSFGLPHLMKAAAEVLGNGSLGSAYMAVMANGLSVVVKRIRDMNKFAPEAFDVEMRRLGKLRHPNVLTPLAYHYRREEKLVVSEYMPNSSLLYVLHGDSGEYRPELTWATRLKIIKGVAQGMQYLHQEFASYDLPHGNLKSSNVLLNENYKPVISDYAFLPFLEPNIASQTLFAYKTPEFAQNQQVSHKSDVYCLGIIILEILTGKFPSQYGKGGTDIVQWVQSSMAAQKGEELIDPEIAKSTDSMQQMLELLRVGAACIACNPDARLDIREVVRRIEQVKT
ncbi:PREDICTED: probable pollen receptor-like kinase 6 [Brassica oleracea var. oleracea]|uniref:Protein kinase domain-containing protein n=1 Tax=Brassica oleracea var. oleracea TaxID=109376 RepID=A0A0D3AK81_BRAOL|nr:PREDICTED: probable pollen receptor-like kinase 6 [Brassica oleracea var. oleracea]